MEIKKATIREDDVGSDVAASKFHAHLDVCERCRERPFDLCPIGAAYLAIYASIAPSIEWSVQGGIRHG